MAINNPKELKQKVVAALYELDNSGDATPGAIAKIARDNEINANVVYQWNSERKARVINSSESGGSPFIGPKLM
ncbi:hypothetical protein [Acidithrix ferrooxidans]|nr:hypothetical protein [Acidithrix ferrooxidans]